MAFFDFAKHVALAPRDLSLMWNIFSKTWNGRKLRQTPRKLNFGTEWDKTEA